MPLTHRLLTPADPPPAQLFNEAGSAPLLIICDHASARIPATLGTLGLPTAALGEHIAIDIGSETMARDLARRLNAPAVIAGYSRLVCDCNRAPTDADWIAIESDGRPVPGNQGLNAAQRTARENEIHAPYHAAITAALADAAARGVRPLVFSVHTFTPVFAGHVRPWHAGVLWNRDGRMARPLIASLRAADGLCIGDNEPYSGRTKAYTLDRHAGTAGLAHCAIEVRQDLVGSEDDALRWSHRLANALAPLIADPALQKPFAELAATQP